MLRSGPDRSGSDRDSGSGLWLSSGPGPAAHLGRSEGEKGLQGVSVYRGRCRSCAAVALGCPSGRCAAQACIYMPWLLCAARHTLSPAHRTPGTPPPAACPAARLRARRGARAVHARVRRRLRCSAPVGPALQRPDTSTPSGDRHQPVTARHPSGHAAQRMCDVPLASAACAARNTQEPRRCAVSPPTGPSVKQVNPSTNEQQTRSDRVCLTREA